MNHQRSNIVYVGRDSLDVFNQKQGLQHVDGKGLFSVSRVDSAVFISLADDAAVAVVQEVFQGVVKGIKGNEGPQLAVGISHGRFFEHGQHGSFPFG